MVAVNQLLGPLLYVVVRAHQLDGSHKMAVVAD